MLINRRHFEAINLPASAEAYDYVGYRVVYKDKESYKIGDTPNRSRVWIDGEPTDELLSGASAISIDKLSYTYDGYEGYLGDTILILGSNNAEGGNDPGEIVMIDAVVLAVIDAETLNLKLNS